MGCDFLGLGFCVLFGFFWGVVVWCELIESVFRFWVVVVWCELIEEIGFRFWGVVVWCELIEEIVLGFGVLRFGVN